MATEYTTDNFFSGLKVVDFARFSGGPNAAVILSDFGADVVKVEPPGTQVFRKLNCPTAALKSPQAHSA
jgi:crotonobetainyl-CoA:carnitine CoA-transferase CaiB-like acyl-CoA transferase